MLIRFQSDGTLIAPHPALRVPLTLKPGRYTVDTDTGEITRYQYGQGMQGFWSSIGSGFSAVGKFIGNHFGTIATVGLGAYAIRSGIPIGQPGATSAQVAAAQAAANAEAARQAQAQTAPSFDLMSILPIVLIGVVAYLVISKR